MNSEEDGENNSDDWSDDSEEGELIGAAMNA